jgi:hypothetical protein
MRSWWWDGNHHGGGSYRGARGDEQGVVQADARAHEELLILPCPVHHIRVIMTLSIDRINFVAF